ncbi:MAG: HI0074 family nucleotidyltransferase substrate-binding subunit [bacterium]
MTTDDRFALELSKFEKSMGMLREALPEDESPKSRDSLLLRFMFTFETAWKSMRFKLSERGMEVEDYSAGVLRSAFQARLVTDADTWEQMRKYRNGVAHAYDEALAIEIAAFVRTRAVPALEALLARLKQAP